MKSAGSKSLVSLKEIFDSNECTLVEVSGLEAAAVESNLKPGGRKLEISTGFALLKISGTSVVREWNLDPALSSVLDRSCGGGVYPGGRNWLTSSNLIFDLILLKDRDLVLFLEVDGFSATVELVVAAVVAVLLSLIRVVLGLVPPFLGEKLCCLKPGGSRPTGSSKWMLSNSDLRSAFGFGEVFDDGTNFRLNLSSPESVVLVASVVRIEAAVGPGISINDLSCDGNALRIPLERSDCT